MNKILYADAAGKQVRAWQAASWSPFGQGAQSLAQSDNLPLPLVCDLQFQSLYHKSHYALAGLLPLVSAGAAASDAAPCVRRRGSALRRASTLLARALARCAARLLDEAPLFVRFECPLACAVQRARGGPHATLPPAAQTKQLQGLISPTNSAPAKLCDIGLAAAIPLHSHIAMNYGEAGGSLHACVAWFFWAGGVLRLCGY